MYFEKEYLSRWIEAYKREIELLEKVKHKNNHCHGQLDMCHKILKMLCQG